MAVLNFSTISLCSSLNSSIVLIIPCKFLLIVGFSASLSCIPFFDLKKIKIKHYKIAIDNIYSLNFNGIEQNIIFNEFF